MMLIQVSQGKSANELMTPHTWYAWFPIRVHSGWVWLEPVERMAHVASFDGYGGMMWLYRRCPDDRWFAHWN